MKQIIITTKENKNKILKQNSKEKRLVNLKFYTFEELKKYIFFDYDLNTIEFIVKNYNVSVPVAKIYLENMYFLNDINDEKIQFLNELKNTLDDHKLLIYNEQFVNNLKNKQILVEGFQELNKKQKLILEQISEVKEIPKKNEPFYFPKIYEAKHMEEEVEFVLNEIAKLIENNIPINNIKIIASLEYENLLNRYFYLFDIPLNIQNTHSYYSTMLAQDFLKQYDKYDINDNIDLLKEKYSNISDLIQIINQSVLIQDKEMRKKFIVEDLKNSKIKSLVYENAVELTTLNDFFDNDDYVFLLGFNVNSYPKIKKDDDFLNDSIKEKLKLDTSMDLNKYAINDIIYKITHIKNLIITYKLNSFTGSSYPSMIINELNLKANKITLDPSNTYSLKYSNIKYSVALDKLYKFNSLDEFLGMYQNCLKIPHLTYNNQFSGISVDKLKKKLNYELTLSYTNMQMYQECAFHYYITKILHLDIYEENFKTILGSIMHHILELGITRDIDIKIEMMKFVKEHDYILNVKELFYLEEFSNELKLILEIIRMQHKNSQLKHYLFEQQFFVYKDKNDLKITFKGNIDKVMYDNINNKEILAVVDYKTGNTDITLNKLEYGLNIQLPIYLYLLKNSERFKSSLIAGFYIQKILAKKEPIQLKKSYQELLKNRLRLQGFTNSEEYLMKVVDLDYLNSWILANLQFKKDGSLSSKAKVLSNLEMQDLIKKVDSIVNEVIEKILEAKFIINPKVINDKNVSCTYCKFRDLCYKRKKNEIVLEGENDELDNTARTSD